MPSDPVTVARANRIEKRLRQHYQAGIQAEAAARAGRPVHAVAARHGLSAYTLRKCRAFARAYSKDELEERCGLRRRDSGLPLQWGHVTYLLIVDDKARRRQLQQEAAKQGWTAPMLNAAIPRKYRLASGHDRRMARPGTIEEGLQQLILEGGHWSRRCSVRAIARGAREAAGKLPSEAACRGSCSRS